MSMDAFAQEFDRYCERNNVPMDKTPEAFQSFLREYGELPDAKGAPLVESAGNG